MKMSGRLLNPLLRSVLTHPDNRGICGFLLSGYVQNLPTANFIYPQDAIVKPASSQIQKSSQPLNFPLLIIKKEKINKKREFCFPTLKLTGWQANQP